MNTPVGSYPRLRDVDALAVLQDLRGLSVAEAERKVDPRIDGLAFYPVAPLRVDAGFLNRLRDGVLETARECGYPSRRRFANGEGVSFEQLLASRMLQFAPMLPGEAADAEVWNFITLRLLPDVAIWRNPLEGDENSAARTDRIIGTRRGMFRQAWWRGFLLGAEACIQLGEDELVQLADRRGVVGHRPLAEAIVETHLSLAAHAGYRRRAAIREALKLVRRELGRSGFEALGPQLIRARVEELFERFIADDQLAVDLDEDPRIAGDLTRVEQGRVPVERPDFRKLAGEYLPMLSTSLYPMTETEALVYAEKAREHAIALRGDPLAQRIASDLASLVGDWENFTVEETSQIRATFDYFLLEDDGVADPSADGLLDDDAVVDALFAALGRERDTGALGT